MLKKIFSLMLMIVFLFSNSVAEENYLSCKSALLMDYESGKILFEHNPHEKLPPASVTKIMTMLITMEEISAGNLKFDDIVTASAYAKSMGGSTIFLDEGEKMTVEDLMKGIAVSSGNDACVAIAEHISGTAQAFVDRMNKRAQELNMVNTHFVNCNGLDDDMHYTTAYDIALMSRELMKYNDIYRFTTIWMDTLRNGQFALSNTNKLIKFYQGATGLKTGSTSKAGFCISATAKRDNLHLIAVIMNSPTSKERQADASSLLNYGFSSFGAQNAVKSNQFVSDLPVSKGKKSYVKAYCKNNIRVVYEKQSKKEPEITYKFKKDLCAPIEKGTVVGKAICKMNGNIVGETEIITSEKIEKVDFSYSYGRIIDIWFGNI